MLAGTVWSVAAVVKSVPCVRVSGAPRPSIVSPVVLPARTFQVPSMSPKVLVCASARVSCRLSVVLSAPYVPPLNGLGVPALGRARLPGSKSQSESVVSKSEPAVLMRTGVGALNVKVKNASGAPLAKQALPAVS
jgi:hypothetical protein